MGQAELAVVRPATIRARPRQAYRYSVIRGGAFSVAELDAALETDPVVAAHYAVFDRARTRLTRAATSQAVYVSYRQGDRVYWTRHKLRLARDEALLTDGVRTARARCGNRISTTPQVPVRDDEPSAAALEEAETPPEGSASVILAAGPKLVHEVFPATPGVRPGGGGMPDGGALDCCGPADGGGLPATGSGEAVPPAEGTSEPAVEGVGTVGATALPPPPAGPGFIWIPPVAPPGGGPSGSGSSGGAARPVPPSAVSPGPGPGGSGGSSGSGPSAGGGAGGPGAGGGGMGLPPAASGGDLPPEGGSGQLGPLPPPPDGAPAPATEVPEPAVVLLLACGAALLGIAGVFLRRRAGR